jgi:CRP/FNR family cyclic AMP-dependent transcriptional regulator
MHFAPGDVLIHEGQHVPWLYVLLAGRAEVVVSGIGKVATREVGEVFGEMSFVDATPPLATVRCEVPSIVLAVDKSELALRIGDDSSFGCRFYRALALFLSDRLDEETRRGRTQPAEQARRRRDDAEGLDGVSQAGARIAWVLETLLGADKLP